MCSLVSGHGKSHRCFGMLSGRRPLLSKSWMVRIGQCRRVGNFRILFRYWGTVVPRRHAPAVAIATRNGVGRQPAATSTRWTLLWVSVGGQILHNSVILIIIGLLIARVLNIYNI